LARHLVGFRLRDIERELILETLAITCGNRTVSAHYLGLSIRTLRNKISEYSSRGFDVARPHSGDGSAADSRAPSAITSEAVA
jgi:DNA-binding NtrC family response regulator